MRYIAILRHLGTFEKKAILVPDGQSLEFDEGTINRKWLWQYLGTGYHLVEFLPFEGKL